MLVRSATADDLSDILAIYNEAVLTTTATADLEPQSLSTRTAWYENLVGLGYPILVAEHEGRTVGWGALMPYKPRPGYRFTAENSVYVLESARGLGIGRALLAGLLEIAHQMPIRNVIAGISGDNEVSLYLHRAFGFREAGRLQAAIYKFDTWIDVVYLQLELEDWSERLL